MITGIHTLLYSDDPDATRAFLRDVLQLPFMETSPGWLIFDTGPSETGARFVGDVWRQDFGRGTRLAVPGMDPIILVEPAYAPAWEAPAG